MNSLTGLQINSMDDLARMGSMLSKCGYFADAKDASQCAVKVLAGLELGIPTFASMTGIYIIKGKPSLSANLMAAMVKKSIKYNYKIIDLDASICQLEFFENKESVGESTFTLEDANKAGLAKGPNSHNWTNYTRNMLFSRAISNGIKWFCPDLFMGAPVYTPEELEVVVNEEGAPLNQIEYVPCNTASNKPISGALNDSPFHESLVQTFQNLMFFSSSPEETWLAIAKKHNVENPTQLDDKVLEMWIDKMKCLRVNVNTETGEVKE